MLNELWKHSRPAVHCDVPSRAVDVSNLVTVTSQQWVTSGSGGASIFTNQPIYFGNVAFSASVNYCGATPNPPTSSGAGSDSYCNPGGGNTAGGFRSFTLSLTQTTNVFSSGTGSSVSYRLSYRAPYTLAPNATDTTAGSAAVTFLMFFQNPLLLSPFAYLGLATPAASVTKAWAGNTQSQPVSLDMPGTWAIDVFNTNGCANITGTTSTDFSAYCYDPSMSEANLICRVWLLFRQLGVLRR
jgi:hypothetical protein